MVAAFHFIDAVVGKEMRELVNVLEFVFSIEQRLAQDELTDDEANRKD